MKKKHERKHPRDKTRTRAWADAPRSGSESADFLGEDLGDDLGYDDWFFGDDARSLRLARFGLGHDPDRWRDDLLERASRRERMRQRDVRKGIL